MNHPSHYTFGGIECIDAIEAALGREGFIGYCEGNAIKYLWRHRGKGGIEDLEKARWYIDRMAAAESAEKTRRRRARALLAAAIGRVRGILGKTLKS